MFSISFAFLDLEIFYFFFGLKKILTLKIENYIYEPKIGGKNSYLQYGFIVIIKNAIKIVHDEVFHEQIKNIEFDCHFIHHYTFHGLLLLDSISSIDQFIGILTKFLSPYHLFNFFFFFFEKPDPKNELGFY